MKATEEEKRNWKKCFACNRPIKPSKEKMAHCGDEQNVYVGSDCFRQIKEQAEYAEKFGVENVGYIEKSGGPNLFPGWIIK